MKTKIYSLALAVMLLFSATSCDDTLDINRDPLAATEADPGLILPFVTAVWVHNRVSELSTRMNDVPQYFSASFASPRNGATTSTLTNNTWLGKYTDVIGNLELVKQDALAAGAVRDNVRAVSLIIQAINYYELTIIWDKIPFSQALDATQFPTPEFDEQQDVLEGIITMLDEATTLINGLGTEQFDISSSDMIYGGDMDNWERYANSMKLRVYMLLRNKSTSYDAAIVSLMSEPLIETNAQAAIFNYSTDPGNENPFQQLLDDFGTGNNEIDEFYFPSEELIDLMNGTNDPRRAIFFTDADGDPSNGITYDGSVIGSFGPSASNSMVRDSYITGDLPEYLFGPAEVDFYQAELMINGVIAGGASGATTKLREGAALAVQLYDRNNEIAAADVTTFTNALPDLSALSTADALEQIYGQQYVEGYMRPLEGWTHVRRTNFPELEPDSASPLSTILKRFSYPPSETGTNPNVPTGINTGDAVWFEN